MVVVVVVVVVLAEAKPVKMRYWGLGWGGPLSGLIRSAMTPVARPVWLHGRLLEVEERTRRSDIFKRQSKSTNLSTVKNRSRTKRSDLVLMGCRPLALGEAMQCGPDISWWKRTKSLVSQVTWGEYLVVSSDGGGRPGQNWGVVQRLP